MNKRIPRKAKKWAKRAKVYLISVSGKRMWYYQDVPWYYLHYEKVKH